MGFDFDSLKIEYPARLEPKWAAAVERWYQLDAPAYGLCQAYVELGLQTAARPELIFLASPGGCNATDFSFAASGASSPAKFVHTLPNIRGSALLQVMGWHGPLLCLQSDPLTLASALVQVGSFADRLWWIVGFSEDSQQAFFLRSNPQGALSLYTDKNCALSDCGDESLLAWLRAPTGAVALSEGWQVCRREDPA